MRVTETADGVLVSVRVRPRSRPGIECEGEEIVVGVAAPAVDGRATEEARRALAEVFGVPRSSVELRSGRTSRAKVFKVQGLSRPLAEQLLSAATTP